MLPPALENDSLGVQQRTQTLLFYKSIKPKHILLKRKLKWFFSRYKFDLKASKNYFGGFAAKDKTGSFRILKNSV